MLHFSMWHSPPAVDEPQMFVAFIPECFKTQVRTNVFNVVLVVVDFVMPTSSTANYNKCNGR